MADRVVRNGSKDGLAASVAFKSHGLPVPNTNVLENIIVVVEVG